MKNFFLSAAIAAVLTIATSTAQLALSQEVKEVQASPLAQAETLHCAIYVGDPETIRPHGPVRDNGRPCESYWANDTDEDERESLQIRGASATPAVAVKR